MFSADDSLGPPGDPRRRFNLPMDVVFDKVCALLHKLSGRAQLSPASKTQAPVPAGRVDESSALERGGKCTRDFAFCGRKTIVIQKGVGLLC